MKTKKTHVLIWSLSLATGLLFSAPALRAEDDGDQAPKKERREGGPAQRLEQLRERLGLSDAQVTQLKEIFAAEREELKALRKELGKDADRAEVREAMREVHEKYIPKIEAVLTPEQREQWARQRERMKERMQERREGGGPGGPGGEGKGEGKKRRGPDGDEGGMPPPPPEEF